MITTALIGSPVDHSVSPILFRLYADEHGLEYAHVKFDVKKENFETVIKALGAFGFAGVNITLPYKTDVMQYLDSISPEAKAIGAVNTIRVRDYKLEGYNTDAYGALRAIEKAAGRELSSHDSALMFGTGGAARAIIWGLLEKKVTVSVVYREPESHRTQSVKNDFLAKVLFINRDALSIQDIESSTLICNATSAGMYPSNDETPIDLTHFEMANLRGVIVFDAIFNPAVTKLQRWADDHGAILAHGIDMMIYQGTVAFEYWTNKKVSDQTVQKAASILLHTIHN